MDWKAWFADQADRIPVAIDAAKAPEGVQKGFWEEMFQAFKARMMEEMKDE